MPATLPTQNDCCNTCSGQTITVVTSGSGGTGSGVLVAATLADLRAFPSSANTTSTIAYLLGNLAIYDFGPAKTYYWDATSTDADNPFSVVLPNDKQPTDQGRYVQVQ